MKHARSVPLSRSEFDYLASAGCLSSSLLERLRRDTQWRSNDAATFALAPADAEEFREAFTEQLAKVGFDQAYELTAEGRLLEDLIDRFDT